MICKKCGAQNEDWQEHCVKCGAYLKKVQLSSITMIFAVLCLIEDVGISGMNIYSLIKNNSIISLRAKIICIAASVLLIVAAIGVIQLITVKKRLGIILNAIVSIIFILYSGFRSPIMLLIYLLPAILLLVTTIPKWKDMELI